MVGTRIVVGGPEIPNLLRFAIDLEGVDMEPALHKKMLVECAPKSQKHAYQSLVFLAHLPDLLLQAREMSSNLVARWHEHETVLAREYTNRMPISNAHDTQRGAESFINDDDIVLVQSSV